MGKGKITVYSIIFFSALKLNEGFCDRFEEETKTESFFFFSCILILKWNLALIYYLYCLCFGFDKEIVLHSIRKCSKKIF